MVHVSLVFYETPACFAITVYNTDTKYHCRVKLRHHMLGTEIITSSKYCTHFGSMLICTHIMKCFGWAIADKCLTCGGHQWSWFQLELCSVWSWEYWTVFAHRKKGIAFYMSYIRQNCIVKWPLKKCFDTYAPIDWRFHWTHVPDPKLISGSLCVWL